MSVLANSLIKPNFIGREQFIWWIGQVEKSVDTAKNSNRVKVRICGYHSNRTDVSSDDLPWAQIMTPATLSQASGQGTKSMLVPGQWVIGFFLDGEDAQIPIVQGCLGAVSKTDNFNAVPGATFAAPENLYSKPNWVSPTTKAKQVSQKTVDPTNDQPHHSVFPTGIFEDVESEATKAIELATDAAASVASVALAKEEEYEVAEADGVCKVSATKDHMLVHMSEFTAELENATQIGEKWINTQTGAVINMASKVQNYSQLMGNIMQSPMTAVSKLLQSEVKKKFPDVMKAVQTANPFELEALKGEQDGVLGVLKCAFQEGILNKLQGMFKNILNGMLKNLKKVINNADCLLSAITDKLFGGILDKISGIMGKIKGLMSKMGGALGSITGIMGKVGGFLKKILGIASCVDPDLNKCVRSKLFNTKSGKQRPKPLLPDLNNPNLDAKLQKLAGGPLPVCDDATKDKTNSMDVIASSFGIGITDMDGMDQIGEKLCGFIPSEVITAYNDGTLDVEAALKSTGLTDQVEINATMQTLATNISLSISDPKAAYDAAKVLGDIGLLFNFTTVSGTGPEYIISGKLKDYFPLDKKHKVLDLEDPFVAGSWVRTCGNPDYFFQVAGSSAYIPKANGKGGGAWVQLPIDEDGYPHKDAIVYDGGSGYGNGSNGNCAPDAFVSTTMYDPETDIEVQDHFLKGTAFVDENGSITAVSFANDEGYVFKETPTVNVTPCGGDVGDPSSNEAVKDPNTLTNQTDTTLIISTTNKGIVGVLQGFAIENVGQGYKNPIITIEGGGGSGAAAECINTYGRITDIKITNSGTGYTSMPRIFIKDEPVTGVPIDQYKGTSAKVYAIIRYMSATDPDLVKKIEGQESIMSIDCP